MKSERPFVAIFGSELDGRLGDKAELIAHALERAGIDAEATAMIGDREHDMLGAARNGVFPAGVLWGYGTDEELRGAGAKRLFGAPGDFLASSSGPEARRRTLRPAAYSPHLVR